MKWFETYRTYRQDLESKSTDIYKKRKKIKKKNKNKIKFKQVSKWNIFQNLPIHSKVPNYTRVPSYKKDTTEVEESLRNRPTKEKRCLDADL
jgi:hypothetical protein